MNHMADSKQLYGLTQDHLEVHLYKIKAGRHRLSILDYGAILLEWLLLDESGCLMTSEGRADNLVLTLQNLKAYEDNPAYVGCVVGRYGGRIQNGDISKMNLSSLLLDQNDRGNCLHGGFEGFGRRLWHVDFHETHRIQLSYQSASGEGGFPGNLKVSALYEIFENGALSVTLSGLSDEDTPFAPTHHAYFNLDGTKSDRTVLGHSLQIFAESMLGVNETSVPSFEVRDLNLLNVLRGEDHVSSVDEIHHELNAYFNSDKGLDYPFLLSGNTAAVLTSSNGKRKLTVLTDCPYVVVYAGGWLGEASPLLRAHSDFEKKGHAARPYSGICFETQEMPNGPYRIGNGPWRLKANSTYARRTVYRFED